MGKKKSVVLITLISVVVAFLCLLTMFPSFGIPFPVDGTWKTWNPVVNQFALSSDLGGGYYTYYYPQGVIPASEYESNYENISDEDEQKEYKDSYVAWKGLYLEKAETSIFDDEDTASAATVSQEFRTQFAKATKLIMSRIEAKGYSASRVAVVDDFAIRMELPASEVNFATAFQTFGNVGKLELQKGGVVLEELEDADITDFIKSFKVRTQYGQVVYVETKLTKAGKELFKGLKSELTASTDTSGEGTTVDVTLGGEAIMQIYSDFISDDGEVRAAYKIEYKDVFETWGIVLNSALEDGYSEISFAELQTDSVRRFDPVYGENALDLLYIALGIILVLAIVLPIVFYRGYGVSCMYSTLSYLVVVAICFAFISKTAFEVSVGSVLIFLLGLLLVNYFNVRLYNECKAGIERRIPESAMSAAYKTTLWEMVDTYAVLLLGAIIFLTTVGGVYTMALQALICLVTAAFCSLLWGRLINYLYMSAAKDKYKYFHFERKEVEDND
ncbi:MAG: hypothetical protein IKA72_02070 [Clostridia bacterium]|nr:hypothetical protein [Clostridia bacterium]